MKVSLSRISLGTNSRTILPCMIFIELTLAYFLSGKPMKQKAIRMDEKLEERLRWMSYKTRLPEAEIMRRALEKYLDEWEKKGSGSR